MRLTVLSYKASPLSFTTVEKGIVNIKPAVVKTGTPYLRRTVGKEEALDDLTNMVSGYVLPSPEIIKLSTKLPAVLDVTFNSNNEVVSASLVDSFNLNKKAVVFEEAHLLGLPYIIGTLDSIEFQAIQRANMVLAPWEQHLGGIKEHYRSTVNFSKGSYTRSGEFLPHGRRVPLRVSTYDILDIDGPLEFPNAKDYQLALAILDVNLRITKLYNISPKEYFEMKRAPYKTRLVGLLSYLIERTRK